MGQRKGYLRATENADVPEEILRPWHVYSTDEWHPAPEVQIVSEEAYGSIRGCTGARGSGAVVRGED